LLGNVVPPDLPSIAKQKVLLHYSPHGKRLFLLDFDSHKVEAEL
jgi:hypothetical protein